MGEQVYWKRDVELVRQHIKQVRKEVDNLHKLSPQRETAVAMTKLDEADHWLRDMSERTPEVG